MNNIIRKFNQNSRTIILDIAIVIGIIIAIQVVNNILKSQKKEVNENKNKTVINTTIQSTKNPDSGKALVTEETIKQSTNENNVEVIDNFIEACNSGNIDKAYEMLSDDCKSQTFISKEYFIEYYYKKFFNTKKSYDYQAWVTQMDRYTYKVKLYEKNIMATGGQNISAIEEYYTIVRQNNEMKININNFVGTSGLNIEKDTQIGKITINKKHTFMEYEIYEIEFSNKTSNNILLDSKEKANTMYLTDEKQNKYSSYAHEIAADKLWIKPGQTIKIEIKYTKQYSNTLEIKTMEFSDIILNYNEYRQESNKSNYKNRGKISIDL